MKCLSILVLIFLFAPLVEATEAAPDSLMELASSGACVGNPAQLCAGHFAVAHGCDGNSVEQGLKKELREFRTLAEQALALRGETIKTGVRIKAQMEQGKPLTGEDISLMNRGIVEHVAFLNIDSIGILRKAGCSREEQANIIIHALRQVGKPYDFNFDVESKGSVYCSKLVYLSYCGIDWPTQKSLGRTTFTPDHVAEKAVNGGSLELVTFYHEGKRVSENPLRTMARLMGTAAAER